MAGFSVRSYGGSLLRGIFGETSTSSGAGAGGGGVSQPAQTANIGPLSDQKIIVMGLPKTGTTSVAVALKALGYNVSHNQGDTLSTGRCNVIANTMELQYPQLRSRYPRATWIVTYASNASAWFDSFAYHVCFHGGGGEGCDRKRVEYFHSKFDIDGTIFEDFPENGTRENVWSFLLDHRGTYVAFYERYYLGLFRFLLDDRQRPASSQTSVPVVDVRAGGGYEALAPVTLNGTEPVDATLPFPHANSRDRVGAWPRCR